MLRNVKGYETRSNNGMMTSTGVYCVLLQMADDEHSACITADGSSYTWGDGCDGKLGHDDETDRSSPTLVNGLVGIKAKEVACGESHTLIRTEDGRVYSFGAGTSDKLGHGNEEDRFTPTLIKEPLGGKFFVQVACGSYHSMAFTRKGCLYTWGCGVRGVLGHGYEVDDTTPYMVKGFFWEEQGRSNENAMQMLVDLDGGLGLDGVKDVCMSYVASNYHKVVIKKEGLQSLSQNLMEELPISLQKKIIWILDS